MTAFPPSGGDPRFSARPGSFDPNADFYATPPQRVTGAPGGGGRSLPGAGPAPAPAPVVLPGRTPVPAWGKVLIAGGGALTALPLLAAVVLPVFLDQRARAVDARVRSDLQAVAVAQEGFYGGHGTYAPDPAALTVAEPDSEVVVLFADTAGYCLGGRDADGRGSVWYLSSAVGVPSTTPCA
ncbi:type IV pilin protein [Kineococcus sp. SYSU DK018]|uniref:type IV pilin protein n=1 Tax=Kineococcus sp. SYSU DK018 TaxID=3383139 RepID=UPI003D7D066E